MLLWFSAVGLAAADVAEADRWLESPTVAVGVNADGSLINAALDLGILWDPPGDPPEGSDLLTPGDAAEIWSATFSSASGSGTLVDGVPAVGSDLVFSWEIAADGPDAVALHGLASGEAVDVETWVALSERADVIWLTLAFTAREAVTDLAVARALDLAPDAGFDGGAATDNATGDGYAVSAGLWDGRALAMASPGGVGGICTRCALPSEVLAGAPGPTEDDSSIGEAVSLGDLAEGETATVTFAYALSMDADSAVNLAIAAAADPDWDGDGAVEDDCDPGDAAVSPSASERWDGADDDCDGAVDEGTAGVDDDGDGVSEADGDCDDRDPAVYPGAAPVAGVADANCDGVRDDGSWDTAADTAAVEAKAGGCAVAGGAARGALALVALGLVLGRRRRG